MAQEGTGNPPTVPPRRCPACGAELNDVALFCPHCGHNVAGPLHGAAPSWSAEYRPQPLLQSLKPIGRGIGAYAVLILLVVLTLNVAILIWSISVIAPIAADPSHGNTLYLIIPWTDPLLNLVAVNGVWFLVYHILLVVAITASFGWMVWMSRKAFPDELALAPLRQGHSPLYVIGTIFFAVMAFNFVWALFAGAFGATPITPSFGTEELWKLLDGFASAAVWEELITRVLIIGVPLLLIDVVTNKVTKPSHYLLGGSFQLGKRELLFLLLSSALFAWGHIKYWDAWKLPPTFIAGIAFGYLFLRVGLYACIMLHFSIDYLTIPTDVWPTVVVLLLLGLVILVWDAVGCVYFVAYLVKIYRFVAGDGKGPKGAAAVDAAFPRAPDPPPGPAPMPRRPQASAPGPPPAPGQGGGFEWRCPYCGFTEASYKDGAFLCLRCGRRF